MRFRKQDEPVEAAQVLWNGALSGIAY